MLNSLQHYKLLKCIQDLSLKQMFFRYKRNILINKGIAGSTFYNGYDVLWYFDMII